MIGRAHHLLDGKRVPSRRRPFANFIIQVMLAIADHRHRGAQMTGEPEPCSSRS
jgi:hypothetical protein